MSLRDKAVTERDRMVAARQDYINAGKAEAARLQADIDALNAAIAAWDTDTEVVLDTLLDQGLIKDGRR